MGSCQTFKVQMVKENVNVVDTIIYDQLEINPTLTCKPMLQFYNQKFQEAPDINLDQLKIQRAAQRMPNHQHQEDFPQYYNILPNIGQQSPTQKGILKTQQSQVYSQETSKKRVSFDKARKRLSTKSLMETQNIRRRKVTMEMLEASF